MCSAAKAQGKEKESRTFKALLFFQETFTDAESLLPRSGWTSASWWEIVNQFLILFCLQAQLFHSLLNCHFLNPWPITFLWFLSQPNGEESDHEVARVFGLKPDSTHYSDKKQEKLEFILFSLYFFLILTVSSSSAENFVGFKSTIINRKSLSLLYQNFSLGLN